MMGGLSVLEDVLAITADAVGRPVSPADTLFDVGADSLRMIEVMMAMRMRFGVAVDVADLTSNTLEGLADLLALRQQEAACKQ